MEKKNSNQGVDPNLPGIIGLIIVGILGSLLFAGYVIEKSVAFALLGVVIFGVLYFGGRWLMTRPISTKLETTRWGRMDIGTKLVMFVVAIVLLLVGFGGTFTFRAPGVGLVLFFVLLYWLLMASKK